MKKLQSLFIGLYFSSYKTELTFDVQPGVVRELLDMKFLINDESEYEL